MKRLYKCTTALFCLDENLSIIYCFLLAKHFEKYKLEMYFGPNLNLNVMDIGKAIQNKKIYRSMTEFI